MSFAFFGYVASLALPFFRHEPILGVHPNLFFPVETLIFFLAVLAAARHLRVRCPQCRAPFFPEWGSFCRRCGESTPSRRVPSVWMFRVPYLGAAMVLAGLTLARRPLIGGSLFALGVPAFVLGWMAAPYLYCGRCSRANRGSMGGSRGSSPDPPAYCSMCGLDLSPHVEEIFKAPLRR
ncbi:MAG: hypothetical protein HYY18_20100 [Planctomycetes bacterium]|nr:hypothetical protein [Planctomycetota bacterium]